jgi:hypothetical protein
MKSTLANVHEQLSDLRIGISSIPRMASKLNQAKRRTIDTIYNLLKFLNEAVSNIDTTLNAIQ